MAREVGSKGPTAICVVPILCEFSKVMRNLLRIADEMQEALGVSELEIDYVPQPVELPWEVAITVREQVAALPTHSPSA